MFSPDRYHLRLFLESVCNFRCVYCNPEAERQDGLTIRNDEVLNILKAGARRGITRVHYTGGEPTLRRGLTDLMRAARELGYVDQVITTNGVLFDRHFDEYVDAGLTRANISIDSVDPEEFAALTGRDELHLVLSAIDKSVQHFGKTKINVVVMKRNLAQIARFIEFSSRSGGRVIPRFIELQSNQPAFFDADSRISDEHVNLHEITGEIERFGSLSPLAVQGENPNCMYYTVGDSAATIGIIANHSRGYPCGDCHKIRISPYGDMGVCINAEGVNIKNQSYDGVAQAMDLSIERREQLNTVLPDRRHHSTNYGFWRWGDVSAQGSSVSQQVNIIPLSAIPVLGND